MESYFCSWSGGKDCCLALDRLRAREPGAPVSLLTMVREDSGRTAAHGLGEAVLGRQAEALGLPIAFGRSGAGDYEEKWRAELLRMKAGGVTAGVFGDIDLDEHYVWIKRVLDSLGLGMVMPLWKTPRGDVVREFLARGHRAVIVSIRKDRMPARFLGRELDAATVDELRAEGIDPSGEGGEFHSLVFDGPLFSRPLAWRAGRERDDGEHLALGLE